MPFLLNAGFNVTCRLIILVNGETQNSGVVHKFHPLKYLIYIFLARHLAGISPDASKETTKTFQNFEVQSQHNLDDASTAILEFWLNRKMEAVLKEIRNDQLKRKVGIKHEHRHPKNPWKMIN